jgi:hypothetical protein
MLNVLLFIFKTVLEFLHKIIKHTCKVPIQHHITIIVHGDYMET